MNVREYYEQALAERGYEPDAAQKLAIDRLQRYYDEWLKFKSVSYTHLTLPTILLV